MIWESEYEFNEWRAHVRRTFLQMLAFERQRYVVPPRMVAVLAGMAT